MDRSKQSVKRGPKVKTLPPSGDFIVLGSKAQKPTVDALDIKLSSGNHKGHSSAAGPSGERKRDTSGSPSPLGPLAKKSKLSSTSSSREADTKKREAWDAIAVDVDATQFVSNVLAAEENGDDEWSEKLILGAIKQLRINRTKPDSLLYLGLILLAKTRPVLFCTDHITDALSSLLRRESSLTLKSKPSVLCSVLASNVLLAAYNEEKNWPDVFVKVYLDDALGDRVWVDNAVCKAFVDNILTVFNTKAPPKGFLPPELNFRPEVSASPPPPAAVSNAEQLDDDTTESFHSMEGVKELQTDIPVFPRYTRAQEAMEQYVLEIIRDQVARRQPMDGISRNVIRVLANMAGIGEVRLLVAQRLEMWMQNPKLTRPAQDLLLSVCMNCNLHNQQDIEVISHLIKIRLKTKPVVNHYLQCIRELLNQNPENLSTVLKHIIYNELSTSRNPNNMALLTVVFQHSPEPAAKILADIFLDVLNNREDYLRAVRVLFREIVRSLRHDMNFQAFCLGLMQERKDSAFKDLDQTLRDKLFLSITDLITLSIFLSITSAVREAASSVARGDKRDIGILRNFQKQVTDIQRDAVWWAHTVAINVFKPGKSEYIFCLRKVLFMEQPEQYYNKDNWPVESERLVMLRLASEVPLLEDTLMRILVIGLSKDHPLSPSDALDMADKLVKRVALLHTGDYQVIDVQLPDLFDAAFQLCAYRYPENITLPQGYQPPALAIASQYWKAWVMCLIITAHNPVAFGKTAWDMYPTLRCFMEMCITNHFTFPPPTMGDRAEEMKTKELQICQFEKQEILEFESHLASASMNVVITEANSLLLPELTTMDPKAICRRPPTQVLEQLKALNQSLKLGHLLCRTRNPDFLLDIIQNQGASQSMPWLADLVESSEGAFDMLPVQCLCEFLLNEELGRLKDRSQVDRDEGNKDETKAEKADRIKRREKLRKQQQLLRHLQELLCSNSQNPQPTLEVLDYFLRRLSSQQITARNQAISGLSLLLAPPVKADDDDDEYMVTDEAEVGPECGWLLKHLPLLPHFDSVRFQTSLALRQALQVESSPQIISGYVQFLAEFAPGDVLQDLADLSLDVAQLIVERTTIMNALLPFNNESALDSSVLSAFMTIFVRYLRRAREPSKEAYSWSEAQDHILIQWSTGEAATMHIFVVHAMIVLLCYGPPSDSCLFDEMLEVWFPGNGIIPQAFLVDTSEEALLFPDWLKLRMIRSSVEVLVDAALKDLEPTQLVLFIQSFGIPIPSVSKLLGALDVAVEYSSFAVEAVVVDKSYMSKFVEVQQQRGANHGARFAAFLGIKDDSRMEEGEDDDMPEEPDLKTSTISIARCSPALIPFVPPVPPKPLPLLIERDVVPKLWQVFGGNGVVSVPEMTRSTSPHLRRNECQNIVRSLQKHLANEARISTLDKPFTRQVIAFLSNVLDRKEGSNLVRRLVGSHSFSCPLFRLLLSSCCKPGIITNPLASKLREVCDKILSVSVGADSPLISLLKRNPHLNAGTSYSEQDQKFPMSFDKNRMDSLLGDYQPESIIRVIEDTVSTCPSHLEQVVQRLMHKGMAANHSKAIITALVKILLNDSSESGGFITANSILVDWLEHLEPEVIDCVSELQQRLLFGRQKENDHATSVGNTLSTYRTCRPYLLAILTHQANWKTLRQCINLLLSRDDFGSDANRYHPSVVLDFLWACISIPKIWQGRDKHIPKHQVEEDVLGVSSAQVIRVADYILTEANEASIKNDDETGNEKLSRNPIETRLPLLLHCCRRETETLKNLIEHLENVMESAPDSGLSSSAHVLLLQVYLQIPRVICYIKNPTSFWNRADSSRCTPSKLDTMSHTLLTALANTESVLDWKDRMQDVDLVCRKLASAHPILMLRQLPMIATFLRGRVHLEFPVFRVRHHFSLFNCVMGLLELLQPYVYKLQYGVAFEDVCDTYFSLIKNHGLVNKELGGLISRFLNVLLEFLTLDTKRAVRFVQKHAAVLSDLIAVYPEHTALRSIFTVVSVPRHMEGALSTKEMDAEEPVPLLLSFSPPQQPSAWTPAQLAPIAARFGNNDNLEDVISALHDLDNISNRKVTILDFFTDQLESLLTHTSETCRNLSYNLLMRYLRHKPNLAKKFLNAFLACFESENYDVIVSALERLAEFLVLSQENGSVLLQRAFHLNMTTSINTVAYIAEVISLLSIQAGS